MGDPPSSDAGCAGLEVVACLPEVSSYPAEEYLVEEGVVEAVEGSGALKRAPQVVGPDYGCVREIGVGEAEG